MNITVVFQLPRELKIGSAWPLGLLEGVTKWCRAHSTTAASAFPSCSVSRLLVRRHLGGDRRSGWSPSCWFLSSTSTPAYLCSIPTCSAATPQWLAFSTAGETLTPELNAFGLFIMESGICHFVSFLNADSIHLQQEN